MANQLTPFGTRFPETFDQFRREMDTLMDRFLRPGNGQELPQWNTPLANVSETDNAYEVSVDLPGMKPDDFDVELKHGELWITGERKEEQEKKEKTHHRIERQYGQFRRVIRLGEDVDPENVEAEYKDGVLKVTVPKKETAATRHIEVKT